MYSLLALAMLVTLLVMFLLAIYLVSLKQGRIRVGALKSSASLYHAPRWQSLEVELHRRLCAVGAVVVLF